MSHSSPTCPVCAGTGATEVLALPKPVPVLANHLLEGVEEAKVAVCGDVRLVFCLTCGHVWNAAFDMGLIRYDEGYENPLHFSPVFSEFADGLVQRLVDRHDLRDRTVVEIGSGQGDFLRSLVRAGGNHGVGFDPSYAGDGHADGDVRFVPSLFPDDGSVLEADFVYARHVLEHLDDPARLVRGLRRSLRDQAVGFYGEVPDGAYLLRETAIWDVVYEHPGHFTGASLVRLLEEGGFSVTEVGVDFGGQFLWADARTDSTVQPRVAAAEPVPGSAEDLASLGRLAADFGARAIDAVQGWDAFLRDQAARGRQVVAWGAGSKGVTFLNLVPAAEETVTAIVDLNPRKHGRHVPGSGHRVIAPQDLVGLGADVVVVMNPLYVDEVASTLAELGVDSTVVAGAAQAPATQPL